VSIPRQPEILPPRNRPGARVFSNENLDLVAHVLDDWLRIPGTSIRFGLDGIVGLVPGIGDVLAGLASCILLVAAWFRGVPYVTLVRMTVNVGIEVVVGSIPFFGDIFDVAWKANRRNYRLLVRHMEQPRRHTWKDWAFLGALATAILLIFAAPLLVIAWLLLLLLHR
jgi:NAD/NADP transhydrogenase beta subunit